MVMLFLKLSKLSNSKLFFLKIIILDLMASMRILRMEIPMNLPWNFFKKRFFKTVEANNLLRKHSARVKLMCQRKKEGYIRPNDNTVNIVI